MVHVAVYFTKAEIKQIKKNAGHVVLKTSPYLRKFYVEALGLNGKS